MTGLITASVAITLFSVGVLVGWVTLGLFSARGRDYED